MLDIKKVASTNNITIAGVLKELEIEEKQTNDGREYVTGKATIKVNQEINGKMVACEPQVRFYSMKLTSAGAQNKLYAMIAKYKEQFTSLAACPEDQPQLASKVIISGAELKENIWVDPNGGTPRSSFQIDAKFMNAPRSAEEYEEGAKFELSGVILGTARETINDEETGRLKVRLGVVGYNGRVDVIDLIAASDNAVNFIEANYQDGDTVSLNGRINMTQTVKTWYEEQGFGEPLKRTKTESRKELVILGGSPSGLEEQYSYDANDIKAGLSDRQGRIEEQKNKAPKGRTQTVKKGGFDPGF